MKIKIGNKIYDANDEPIMIILSEKDKWNICTMSDWATKYCAYPEDTPQEFIEDWMKEA